MLPRALPAALRAGPLAALLLTALLAGCLGPKPEVTLEVLDFDFAPNPAGNNTAVQARIKVTAIGTDVRDVFTNFWVKDAARGVLLDAQVESLTLPSGQSKVVNFSKFIRGMTYPILFVAHGKDLEAEAWPPVARNGHPFGTRLNIANATWDFPGSYPTDRQTFHFVVDNTAVATPATGPLRGTLLVKVNGVERFARSADLAVGAFTEAPLVVRDTENVEVTWTGPAADVLVYVGDQVFAEYERVARP